MKQFLWKSNFSSPDQSQVSILALTETILAIFAYGWIAYKWGLLHLVLAAFITPLLLLRTEESTKLGLKLAERAMSYLRTTLRTTHDWKINPKILNIVRKSIFYIFIASFALLVFRVFAEEGVTIESLLTIFVIVFVGIIFLGAFYNVFIIILAFLITVLIPLFSLLAIRVYATIVMVIKKPAKSISHIPSNWWRMVACVDTFFPPEPIPGVIAHSLQSDKLALLTLPGVKAKIRKDPSDLAYILFTVPAVFIPSILYRWSLKGTSLLWSPLIWALRTTHISNLVEVLKSVKHLALHKMMRIYSVFVLAFIVSKFFAVPYWNDLVLALQDSPASSFFRELIAPTEVPLWQLAALINALLTWILYLISDYMLFKYDTVSARAKSISLRVIQTIFFSRSFLSYYTIGVTIFIAFNTTWKIAPIGTDPFPWHLLSQN